MDVLASQGCEDGLLADEPREGLLASDRHRAEAEGSE